MLAALKSRASETSLLLTNVRSSLRIYRNNKIALTAAHTYQAHYTDLLNLRLTACASSSRTWLWYITLCTAHASIFSGDKQSYAPSNRDSLINPKLVQPLQAQPPPAPLVLLENFRNTKGWSVQLQ